MTRRFVAQWRVAHPGGEVIERDLMRTELSFVHAPWLQAYFKPAERHSPEMKAALPLSDEMGRSSRPTTSSSPRRSTTTTSPPR